MGLNCLLVILARSKARVSPAIVTARAASFIYKGMDITGVFNGVRLVVMTRPARILPQASRLIGLITAVLFSLIGEKELKRGCPIDTKKTTRKL